MNTIRKNTLPSRETLRVVTERRRDRKKHRRKNAQHDGFQSHHFWKMGKNRSKNIGDPIARGTRSKLKCLIKFHSLTETSKKLQNIFLLSSCTREDSIIDLFNPKKSVFVANKAWTKNKVHIIQLWALTIYWKIELVRTSRQTSKKPKTRKTFDKRLRKLRER